MKPVTCSLLFLLLVSYCRAQPSKDIANRFKKIIKLIEADKENELAKMVKYPLKRQNPLPDIADSKAFIADYPILFDDAFKQKLKRYNDTDIFEHDGAYGLVNGPFNGDIWLNEDGAIGAINYSSKWEQELRAALVKKIQGQMYPAVNSWIENIVVGKSDNLLIRIDDTGKGARYVSWSKGRPTSEKPDLILYNGIQQARGTMGGWTWTFKNGDWTYIVDDVEMCEDPGRDCGLFLRLLFKGAVKSTVRLKEIK